MYRATCGLTLKEFDKAELPKAWRCDEKDTVDLKAIGFGTIDIPKSSEQAKMNDIAQLSDVDFEGTMK